MPFQKGKSWQGNVKGRPRNTGHRQKLFNALVVPHKEILIGKAIQMACEGNEAMLRFFLDRLIPAKILEQSLEFQDNTFQKTIQNLLAYVAAGDLSADEANKIASILYKNVEITNQKILLEKIVNLDSRLSASDQQNIEFNQTKKT